MTAKIVEIRAREISALRRQNRALRAELSALRDRAGENDATLMTLHQLALLLAENGGRGRDPRKWAPEAETFLARRLCGPRGGCRIFYFGRTGGKGEAAELKRAAMKMRLDGHAGDSPPPGTAAVAGMRSYCAAPLRRGRETTGMMLLSSRRQGAFPPDASRDFLRRLAQLLAAAAP